MKLQVDADDSFVVLQVLLDCLTKNGLILIPCLMCKRNAREKDDFVDIRPSPTFTFERFELKIKNYILYHKMSQRHATALLVSWEVS